MYPHHVFDLEPAGAFGMYPICYQRVSGRYFQPEPAMYSRCFCWFPGPLAPSVGVFGNGPDDQGGDEDNVDTGASMEESMRRDSPMPREGGLIAEMEREATEAGLGEWFNGNPEDVLESWSGANSNTSASQDQVGMTLLTTIGS